jgi:uncharacterized protein (TIGR02757 family)
MVLPEARGPAALLKERLDELYASFDAGYIHTDPIQFPHRFGDPLDVEIAGFIAAAFAYGNVASIRRNLEKIFSVLGPHPSESLLSMNTDELSTAWKGFKHRFTTEKHLSWFLLTIRGALLEHGSLKNLFLEKHTADAPNLKDALTHFVDRLLCQETRTVYSSAQEAQQDGAFFLLPSPRSGSACKRLNLFLRWMVRAGDDIDFALWTEIRPSQLVIPLDTHVARLSRYLGLTRRKTSDWRTAEEITNALRTLDPIDPLKYDFSLTRLGILGDCDSKEGQSRCGECALSEICGREVGAL